ncbi:MAG: hypothetical protein JWL77_367, partial [Chthonomonadaceae bacterium]|nr:hypothetical protein [Chthonomonadaceae bacterium]
AHISAAHAQGQSPFTIRKPLDGSSVREKVRIEIPRASIGSGGFVALYVDGKFALALAPQDSEDGKPFTYLWDTKTDKISDGEHTIRAVLFEPSGSTGATQKGSSEVKVNVANIIHDGPTSLLLRYKYAEGVNRDYAREGKSFVVGGVSETGTTTSNQNLADVKSKIHFDIQDVSFDRDRGMDVALVRNKLTQLSILQNGSETILDPGQLSNSVYQELASTGKAFYELGTAAGLAEFMSLGLPVNNTLELPELPTARVQIGDTWATENQRIDIPGMPPALQPKVKIDNKLVDLEWQDGYPTARIHQSYKSTPSGVKTVLFGPVEITNPVISFDRDIYVAYNSGVLIKTTRSLTVAGRTTYTTGSPSQGGGYPGGYMPGGPGSGGGPGGSPAMRVPGGMQDSLKGGGFPGGPGSGGGYPGAGGGAPGSGGGYPGAPGRGKGGGFPGGPGSGGGYPGAGGGAPGSGGGYPGNYPGAGGGAAAAPRTLADILGAARGGGNGGNEQADHAITVKAVTDTTLVSNTGGQTATTRTASLKTVKKTRKITRKH